MGKEDITDLLIYGAVIDVTWKTDVTSAHADMIQTFLANLNSYHLKDIVKDSTHDVYDRDYLRYSLNEVIQQKLPDLKEPEKHYNLTFDPSPTSGLQDDFFTR